MWLAEIRKRNAILYTVGWLHLALFAMCLFLYFVKPVAIAGINGWIKPMKFALSLCIYLWTFGWLLHYIGDAKKVKVITWTIAACMCVEMIIIFVQAWRGVGSHFNISTPLNGALFATMGTFIGINSLAVLYTLILFINGSTNLTGGELLAWQMGLFLFFVGGISGGMMSGHLAHTYGSGDGGPGLPFVNWSTQAGDMRPAHFLTLHGLQLLPLFYYAMFRRTEKSRLGLMVVFVLFLFVCLALHVMALRGVPLIATH